jgi:hypothetical protein
VEAHRVGLVTRLVEDQDLDAAALSLAEFVVANAPLSVRAAKAAIAAVADPDRPGMCERAEQLISRRDRHRGGRRRRGRRVLRPPPQPGLRHHPGAAAERPRGSRRTRRPLTWREVAVVVEVPGLLHRPDDPLPGDAVVIVDALTVFRHARG